MRETPVRVWILAKSCGQILSAHCICMAGQGETCSHVGAILFAVETGVRLRDALTCTQTKSYWLPAHVKNVPYLPVKAVDFSSTKAKKILLEKHCRNLEEISPSMNNIPLTAPVISLYESTCSKVTKPVNKPSEEEIKVLFTNISKSYPKASILTVLPEFQDKFVKEIFFNFPAPLTALFDETATSLTFINLLEKSEDVYSSLNLSSEMTKAIERATKLQAAQKLWFSLRAGRITASQMKAVCRTNPEKPSVSLITKICYPFETRFTTAATKWGCDHEKDARKQYEIQLRKSHENFIICDSGLQINPSFPHLGASPDGLVECDCCGKGICEVKCPYCYRDKSATEQCLLSNSCLITQDGEPKLDPKHAYYYQVQTQIFVCSAKFCDFVLWTKKELHVERITPNASFWDVTLKRANVFFKCCILPELLARWFTKQPHDTCAIPISDTATKSTAGNDVPLSKNSNQVLNANSFNGLKSCYCGVSDSRIKVNCNNENCNFEFFHLECLQIKHKPRSKTWKCPDCRKIHSKAVF